MESWKKESKLIMKKKKISKTSKISKIRVKNDLLVTNVTNKNDDKDNENIHEKVFRTKNLKDGILTERIKTDNENEKNISKISKIPNMRILVK